MECEPPAAVPGLSFDCAGSNTPFGDSCRFRGCTTGDAFVTCNKDDGDETVSWNKPPSCMFHYISTDL